MRKLKTLQSGRLVMVQKRESQSDYRLIDTGAEMLNTPILFIHIEILIQYV